MDLWAAVGRSAGLNTAAGETQVAASRSGGPARHALASNIVANDALIQLISCCKKQRSTAA